MRYRNFLNRLPLAAAVLAAAIPAFAVEKYPQAQDMPYGAALYDYFQGNYFDALSTLMVAEERGTLRVHADNAALIEGAISLGFGLQQRAADLFTQQLQQTDGDPQKLADYRRIAWLKLAQLAYRQQDWPGSADYLQQSGAADHSLLAVSLALHRGDLAAAEQLLQSPQLEKQQPLPQLVLAHINLAAAHARAQRYGTAVQHYQRAAALAASGDRGEDASPEISILRDRAHIGAGYAYALQQRYPQALEEFRQVQLHTAWAERALLGMGWAAINGGDYQAAASALQFLLERDSDSPAAREALVALPYSYEKLDHPRAALQAYRRAEQHYRASLAELQQLQSDVSALSFAPEASGNSGEAQRYGWLQAAETPPALGDQHRYLQRLLQSDAFQLRLTELRDLRQLAQVIGRWQQQLPLFGQLLDARGERRRGILDNYNSAQYDQQVDIAQRQYQQLAASLARIEQQRDFLALAKAAATDDGEEEGENRDGESPSQESLSRKMLARVERAEARYRKLASLGKARPAQEKSLQRARGILLWRAAQDYHDNLWQQHKALRDLEQNLHSAAERQQQVDRIARRAPQLQQLQTRVDSAAPRLAQQRIAIASASARIEASIRRDVLTALKRERTQIRQYMAHSRLAIARLQDGELNAPREKTAPVESGPSTPSDSGRTESDDA